LTDEKPEGIADASVNLGPMAKKICVMGVLTYWLTWVTRILIGCDGSGTFTEGKAVTTHLHMPNI